MHKLYALQIIFILLICCIPTNSILTSAQTSLSQITMNKISYDYFSNLDKNKIQEYGRLEINLSETQSLSPVNFTFSSSLSIVALSVSSIGSQNQNHVGITDGETFNGSLGEGGITTVTMYIRNCINNNILTISIVFTKNPNTSPILGIGLTINNKGKDNCKESNTVLGLPLIPSVLIIIIPLLILVLIVTILVKRRRQGKRTTELYPNQ